jgi:hypothetical protein
MNLIAASSSGDFDLHATMFRNLSLRVCGLSHISRVENCKRIEKQCGELIRGTNGLSSLTFFTPTYVPQCWKAPNFRIHELEFNGRLS